MISLNTRKPADLLTLHGGSIVDYVCDEPCPIEKPSRIKVTKMCIRDREEETSPELNLRKVYDFALTAPLDEIRFILDTARLNKAAAEQAFKGNYGPSLGKMLRGTYEHKVMGDSVFSHILSYTSACLLYTSNQ